MKSRKAQIIRVSEIASWIPQKSKTDHKKSSGELLVVAGSKKYPGASRLAVEAASRMGAGTIHLCSDQDLRSFFPDTILAPKITKQNLLHFSVILIGPGLTQKSNFQRQLKLIQKNFSGLVIIDASALTWLAEIKKSQPNFILNENYLLTPHEGEMARLLGRNSKWVRENRQESLEWAQKSFNCSILLKGDSSLLADANALYKIKAGNAALAKAGTGDILSGMIAGLALQTGDLTRSALIAATLHGSVADLWVKENLDILSLTPSDILQKIPKLLLKLRKKVRSFIR